MNITLDDSAPSLNYSSKWRRQPSADDNYFFKTYRASQSKGDTMTLTFDGSAIYVYGSRGPNHGNYSVQFDDAVQFFPGFSNNVKYQSLLFSRTFTPGPHSIVLTNQENFWLDVDFVAITVASTVNTTASDPGVFSSTVSPVISPAIDPSASSTGIVQPNSSTVNASPTFFILTIVLASILGISLFFLIAFCWWKRRKDFEYARELSFRYGHNGKPTPPKLSQEGSASGGGRGGAVRSSMFGNALLGILPGSRRGTPSSSGRSVPTNVRHPEKKRRPDIAESITETRGEGDSMIALTNFGERPRFPAGDGRKAHAGELARSDNGSMTELSEARSWRTGGTSATPGVSPGSAMGWGSSVEKESSKAPGSPKTVVSNVSDGQLSQWTARPTQAQRSQLGAPIMSSPPGTPVPPRALPTPPENASTSNLTAYQLIAQRQRQEGRPFSPARSDVTAYSTSEAAAYASRHKSSRSGGSGGYAHLPGGAGGPQPLKPPPRTERDKERERLEKIEREERERQERLASAKYDRVAAVMDRNRYPGRPPPPYATTLTQTQQQTQLLPSSSRTDIHAAVGAANFDRDLELARAGSPAYSARSTSARGTVATGSMRDYTPTPDIAAQQRSYTPDDRTAGGGGRYTPERYNGAVRQQERSYSPGVGAWDGRGG